MLTVAVFAPLAGAFGAGLLGRVLGDAASRALTVGLMLVATVAAQVAFWRHQGSGGGLSTVAVADWVQAGAFRCAWVLRADTLSLVMVAMVTFVAMLVHLYSIGYMGHEDRPVHRFFAYLSLFSFAMLMLVTSDNLIQLFFGWEGVGLASYLLIGYWYDRPSANAAAIKAFVFNRVADLFFMVGIALAFLEFGSVQYDAIFAGVGAHAHDAYHVLGIAIPVLEAIGVLLFIGAMGKSAQLFFHPWLADAMEGPTPVSALIHAATMVTAGVFLVARFAPLLLAAPVAMHVIALVGATTCAFAATIGLVQSDIKRVIAWSTCSQLGYMFLGCGVGAFDAGMFHLLTHACFKALLFLAAGAVIHALADEQDLFRMGGLWRRIPLTYAAMWCGALALGGIPPFSGFWSKDAIIAASWNAGGFVGTYGWILGTLTAGLTTFYIFRLLFMAFHGESRVAPHTLEHVHEAPMSMLVPLLLLSIGALGEGALLAPSLIGTGAARFWHGSLPVPPLHDREGHVVAWLPSLAALFGLGVAWVLCLRRPALASALRARLPGLHDFLYQRWYFDQLYDAVFVRPYRRLAAGLWRVGDRGIIDASASGLGTIALGASSRVVRIQTGSIAVYAFTMLIGLVALLGVFLVGRLGS